jgi:hypothetical protein
MFSEATPRVLSANVSHVVKRGWWFDARICVCNILYLGTFTNTEIWYTHTHIYIIYTVYIQMWTHICVCECVPFTFMQAPSYTICTSVCVGVCVCASCVSRGGVWCIYFKLAMHQWCRGESPHDLMQFLLCDRHFGADDLHLLLSE